MNQWMNQWINEWINQSMNQWTSESMNQWINEPMNEPMNQWMNQWTSESMNQWMNEPMNQWMNQWINEPMNQWTNEWMNQWMSQWINESINEWMSEWMNQSINQSINESMNQWINESMNQWTNEWANESMNESMNQWINELSMNQWMWNTGKHCRYSLQSGNYYLHCTALQRMRADVCCTCRTRKAGVQTRRWRRRRSETAHWDWTVARNLSEVVGDGHDVATWHAEHMCHGRQRRGFGNRSTELALRTGNWLIYSWQNVKKTVQLLRVFSFVPQNRFKSYFFQVCMGSQWSQRSSTKRFAKWCAYVNFYMLTYFQPTVSTHLLDIR